MGIWCLRRAKQAVPRAARFRSTTEDATVAKEAVGRRARVRPVAVEQRQQTRQGGAREGDFAVLRQTQLFPLTIFWGFFFFPSSLF